MSRIATFVYGLACYAVFLGVFLYAIGFIGGFLTPTQLDGAADRPLLQVWRHLRGESYRPPQFRTPSLYRVVRHPLYVGWLIIFWAAPTMTIAHLVFAVMTTAYILIAIQFEERDLTSAFGSEYSSYKRRTPMLIPRIYSR